MKLLITIDVDTDKPKARALTISAARPDELPIIRQGAFADRHALLDGVYVEALKRKEAPVKRPKDGDTGVKKPAAKTEEKTEETEIAEVPEIAEEPEEKPDQLVQSETPAAAAPETLPEIENDTVPEETQPALLEGIDEED